MGCDHEHFSKYWMITWNTDPSNNCSPMATEFASTNKWVFWYKRSTAGMRAVNNWLVGSGGMNHVWPVVCLLLIKAISIFLAGVRKKTRGKAKSGTQFLHCFSAMRAASTTEGWLVSPPLLSKHCSYRFPWHVVWTFMVRTGWIVMILAIL